MNKGQLITDLKNRIGPGVDVDDTGLSNWINDSYGYLVDEIVKVNPDYFVKATHTASFAGQQEYTLPSNFERILMVNIQIAGVWTRATPLSDINAVPIQADTSTPGYSTAYPRYYIVANRIGFLPIPAETVSLGIKIWYVYTPPELSVDSDVPAIPTKYHQLINYGALANYLDRDGDHSGAELLRRRFEKRVGDTVETMSTSEIDEPKSIVIETDQELYMDDLY